VLDRSGVLPVIGQFKSGGVPQHVGMDGHVEPGGLSCPGYNFAEG